MARTAKRIVVLCHARERHDSSHGVVDDLAQYWRKDGFDVVYLFGTRTFVPADLVLVHVNLSVVPDEYLTFASHYPIVLNGRIRDIRKSVISSNLVRQGDAWTGPVIVKSELNFGGVPERMLLSTWLDRHLPGWPRACRVMAKITGREEFTDWTRYRVFDSVREVPSSLFKRKDVVVERFLPEYEDGLFHLRMYQVLGDRWTCTRLASPHPVFKASMSVSFEMIEPHSEVELWRKRFKLDYGKLDYVIHQ